MSSHHAIFRFSAGGFDLNADAFGRRWEFERDGRPVKLSLPSRPDSFGPSVDALTISTRTGENKEMAWDEGRVLVAVAEVFEVSIDVDVAISSTELNPQDHLDEIKRGQKALDLAGVTP